MVGDRSHDALGARAVATAFIGVAWGFGTPAELADRGSVPDRRDASGTRRARPRGGGTVRHR